MALITRDYCGFDEDEIAVRDAAHTYLFGRPYLFRSTYALDALFEFCSALFNSGVSFQI